MMSRELWPILDRHTDNIALGNGFDALVPISAHDIRTQRLEAVVNHHHRVSAQFSGFLAQLLFDIIAECGGMGGGVHGDFTEAVVGLRRFL
jgi:hypothetical protein